MDGETVGEGKYPLINAPSYYFCWVKFQTIWFLSQVKYFISAEVWVAIAFFLCVSLDQPATKKNIIFFLGDKYGEKGSNTIF